MRLISCVDFGYTADVKQECTFVPLIGREIVVKRSMRALSVQLDNNVKVFALAMSAVWMTWEGLWCVAALGHDFGAYSRRAGHAKGGLPRSYGP